MKSNEIITHSTIAIGNERFSRSSPTIKFLAIFFLIFGITLFANERESTVAQLKQVLFNEFPSDLKRKEIDRSFQEFLSTKFSHSNTTFSSAGERAYWETLKYPSLWEELCVSLDEKLLKFIPTGNVSDELRFTIVQLYLFGRLEYRPIFFCDEKGIDTEDRKLPFSTAIGPAIEMARFIRKSDARKVFEVFSGRGNMTLLLSLAGLEELITVELDTDLNIEASWKCAIDKLYEEIPPIFWPKVTTPLFLSGDILKIDLPSVDSIVMDPPYGYASSCNASTATTLLFFLDVLARLQEGSFRNIYALIPTEWTLIVHLFTDQSNPTNLSQTIDHILQKSIYYQCKPDKWAPFMQAMKEDIYVENLKGKIGKIGGISNAKRTPIRNILGKELDIFQVPLSD